MDNPRTPWSPPFRLLALVVVLTLITAVATPARADADVLTALAIASAVVAGVILIAYLVIASVDSSGRADAGRVVWLACTGDDCAALAARAADAAAPVAAPTPVESP
jgi:hypothetical protein